MSNRLHPLVTAGRKHPGPSTHAAHAWRLTGLAFALAATLAAPSQAWDSPRGQIPVPEHISPWREAQSPGLNTLLLWKFSTEHDTVEDADALLHVDVRDMLAEGTARQIEMPEEAREPRLQGGAQVVTDAGRFGGGLVLDGTGFADCPIPYHALLHTENGFTLDFWFRRQRGTTAPDTELLVMIPDPDGNPLLTVRIEAGERVTLVAGADAKLAVPLGGAPDRWRHAMLAVSASGGRVTGRITEVTLGVDQHRATDDDPIWFNALTSRFGRVLTVGGGHRQQGLRGTLDEVRLQRGRRHFYPHALHLAQRDPAFVEVPVAPPFFRNDDVALRMRFNGALEPEAGAGLRARGKADARSFKPGIRGQALDLSRIDQADFALANADLFPNLTGTVEFWMRPLDWNNFYVGNFHGTDVQRMPLLGLIPPDALRYNQESRGRPTQSIRVPLGRSGSETRFALWTPLHPGTWTHVLISAWGRDRRQNTVYLNGVPARQVRVEFSDSLRVLGRHARRDDDKFGPGELVFEPSGTLIDELSVYPWAMDGEEAWNAYARWLPDAQDHMRPLPPFNVEFRYAAHSWHNRDRLVMRVFWLPIDGARIAGVEAILRDAAGTVLHTSERQELDDTGNTRFRAYVELPFGHYQAQFRAYDADGKLLGEEQAAYERVRPEWYENTLGLERTVPDPWTPMQVEGSTVRLWGRELTLGPGGLPATLTTLEIPVLATPVTMTVSGPAGATVLSGSDITFTETADDRVAWRATLTGGGLRAELDAWMEFDGLLYWAVNLLPEGKADSARIETLHVDFPMNPENAAQLIANGSGNTRRSWDIRFVPEGQGRVWDGLTSQPANFDRALKNFLPHIWVGGDIAGLYFGGDNDQGWTVNDELDSPAQEVRRQDNAVVYRMNVIRESTDIGVDGHRFHFAVHPTPAKPAPEDWRQRLRGGPGTREPRYWFGAMDVFSGANINDDPENPGDGDMRLEPHCWEHATIQAAELRDNVGLMILYANASWPKPGPAFQDWNHDMWARSGRIAWTPEFEDYAVWAYHEYIKRGIADAIYVDNAAVGGTFSLASTGYELPDGTRRMGFTALAQRRFLMRLWRLFLAAGKVPDIGLHMTYGYRVPLFSFARYVYNGEVFDKGNFMDVWPPDRLRIMAGAEKWGVGVQWVTHEIRGSDEYRAYFQNRALHGNYMAADVLSADIPGNGLLQAGLLAPGVKVYPFWNSDQVLTLNAPAGANVVGTVYAHSDRVFVQVTNYEHAEHEVTMTLQAEQLLGTGEVIWRDSDPGLQPPEQKVASRKELQQLADTRSADSLFAGPALSDDLIEDLLDDTTPAERDMRRWTFDPNERPARVVVRPRDFRIFEVRPVPPNASPAESRSY